MGCRALGDKVYCTTWGEARDLDVARNDGWFGKVTDGALEAAKGVGDAAWSLLMFPEDVAKYVTGTDAYYGQRRAWSYFGDAAQFNWSLNNPVFRVVNSVNSVVYGGLNLALGYTPNYVMQKIGVDIPYFTPPPATVREQARDAAFLATMLFGPKAAAVGRQAMGIPARAVPVAESAVARWAREQETLSRMSSNERALTLLFADPQTGAVRIRVGDGENYVPGGVHVYEISKPVRWRTSNAENYVPPDHNLSALYSMERDSGGKIPIDQRVIRRLTTMAQRGDVDAIDALGYLGESKPELLDEVVSALSSASRAGYGEAGWKISALASHYPEAALRWQSARGR